LRLGDRQARIVPSIVHEIRMDAMAVPPFRPHPLFRGGHAQTLAGAYLPGVPVPYRAKRHTVRLPDGDSLVLHDDRPPFWRQGDRAAVLVHGLAGSHGNQTMARTAAKLCRRGVRVFRMDLRGCGAGVGLARLPYHAGRSEDAAAALARTAEICPGSPLALVGFSLGGNIALKLAGESGEAPPGKLDRVIAVAPPIDLLRCSLNIGRGVNRVYDAAFVRRLVANVRRQPRHMPARARLGKGHVPRTLLEFDDRITAPLGGFASAEEYYARSSAGPLLASIRVATWMLAAEDDPLVPAAIYAAARLSDHVELSLTRHGGHLGYFGVAGMDADRRWMEWRVVERVVADRRELRRLGPGPVSPGAGFPA
jgi:predicted alpha/beta-fold hydrolase